jgi:hypothetical protein
MLLIWYFIKDTKKAIVSGIYVYPLDNKTTVNNAKRPVKCFFTKDGGNLLVW